MLTKVLIVAGLIFLGGVAVLASFSLFSKKPDNLGVADGRLAPCPATPNCVCTHDTDSVHGSRPLEYSDDPEEAWARLKAVLAKQPRCKVVIDDGDYLHAEFTSLLFRYVDDVEFQLDSVGKVIHFRSASRAGRSDLGVNRARMEAIREAFGG